MKTANADADRDVQKLVIQKRKLISRIHSRVNHILQREGFISQRRDLTSSSEFNLFDLGTYISGLSYKPAQRQEWACLRAPKAPEHSYKS